MPKPKQPPGHFNEIRRAIGWRPASFEQLTKFHQLGGATWLRARLDDEIDKLNSTDPATRPQAAEEPI